PFRAASPLMEYSEQGGKLHLRPFDLNESLGKGQPVALIFWQPGFRTSEEGLIQFARFLRAQAPRIKSYAVVGAGGGERAEIQWETYCLLGLPPDFPLLRDEEFSLVKQLQISGFPALALFDGKGILLTSQLQALKQAALVAGAPSAEDLLRRVGQGESPT